ncbi:hypothetical protein ABPG75_009397 [Micractinium tetrahymenae]
MDERRRQAGRIRALVRELIAYLGARTHPRRKRLQAEGEYLTGELRNELEERGCHDDGDAPFADVKRLLAEIAVGGCGASAAEQGRFLAAAAVALATPGSSALLFGVLQRELRSTVWGSGDGLDELDERLGLVDQWAAEQLGLVRAALTGCAGRQQRASHEAAAAALGPGGALSPEAVLAWLRDVTPTLRAVEDATDGVNDTWHYALTRLLSTLGDPSLPQHAAAACADAASWHSWPG